MGPEKRFCWPSFIEKQYLLVKSALSGHPRVKNNIVIMKKDYSIVNLVKNDYGQSRIGNGKRSLSPTAATAGIRKRRSWSASRHDGRNETSIPARRMAAARASAPPWRMARLRAPRKCARA